MKNVTIEEGPTINYSIVDSDTTIGKDCVIGRTKSAGEQITVIGSDLNIREGCDIPAGEMVNAEWLAKNGENA